MVRRRKRNDVNDYTDMLHFNDMMGTAREEVNPTEVGSEVQGSAYGYVTTADGEPLSFGPSANLEENHIQFHGGFLEDRDFHESFDRGYFYRMGIRHYSPGLGRFLQRDPLSYLRVPPKGHPLNLNTYIYGNNRPTQLSDRSGYQACPSCGTPSGGITPMVQWLTGPGFGQDGSSGGGHGGGGGGGWGDDETDCAVYYPEECIDDEDYPNCTRLCCRSKNTPAWWNGCCCGDCTSMYPEGVLCEVLKEKTRDDCDCACCWAGGEENAPTPIGSSSGGSGGSGGGSSYGPPSYGPWGEGGNPWWIGPIPVFPTPIPQIPTNSWLLNMQIEANVQNSLSQLYIGFSKESRYLSKPNSYFYGFHMQSNFSTSVNTSASLVTLICGFITYWVAPRHNCEVVNCICACCRTVFIVSGVAAFVGLKAALFSHLGGGAAIIGGSFGEVLGTILGYYALLVAGALAACILGCLAAAGIKMLTD